MRGYSFSVASFFHSIQCSSNHWQVAFGLLREEEQASPRSDPASGFRPDKAAVLCRTPTKHLLVGSQGLGCKFISVAGKKKKKNSSAKPGLIAARKSWRGAYWPVLAC